MESIFNKVKDIIADISFCGKDEVVPEASFTNDLGIDFDFDFPLLIDKIQEEFNIYIPGENYEDFFCVGELVRFIEARLI